MTMGESVQTYTLFIRRLHRLCPEIDPILLGDKGLRLSSNLGVPT